MYTYVLGQVRVDVMHALAMNCWNTTFYKFLCYSSSIWSTRINRWNCGLTVCFCFFPGSNPTLTDFISAILTMIPMATSTPTPTLPSDVCVVCIAVILSVAAVVLCVVVLLCGIVCYCYWKRRIRPRPRAPDEGQTEFVYLLLIAVHCSDISMSVCLGIRTIYIPFWLVVSGIVYMLRPNSQPNSFQNRLTWFQVSYIYLAR